MASGDPTCPKCGNYLSNTSNFMGRHECAAERKDVVTFHGPGFPCKECPQKDAELVALRAEVARLRELLRRAEVHLRYEQLAFIRAGLADEIRSALDAAKGGDDAR